MRAPGWAALPHVQLKSAHSHSRESNWGILANTSVPAFLFSKTVASGVPGLDTLWLSTWV